MVAQRKRKIKLLLVYVAALVAIAVVDKDIVNDTYQKLRDTGLLENILPYTKYRYITDAGHFVVAFLLAIYLNIALHVRLWLTLFFTSLIMISLEFVQYLAPSRESSMLDIGYGMVGGVVGVLLLMFVSKMNRRAPKSLQ